MSLLGRLFSRSSARNQESTGTPQPETPVFVIGDIHGCAELLQDLLSRIDATPEDHRIVCVGDFVDRGESSAEVLGLLRERQSADPDRFICLMGNHEKMMLDFIHRTQERGPRWLRNGGLQTLASFRVAGATEGLSGDRLDAVSEAFAAAMGPDLLGWVENLPLSWTSGSLTVVHAAMDPQKPLADQNDKTLLWGHKDFLNTPRQDGLWVAHGHTVFDDPFVGLNRISVDTGAYFTGQLTAARIDPDGTVSFIHT